ncbi:MAG: cysteine--tRNA ligase [Nanoarchaeota archaeon]
MVYPVSKEKLRKINNNNKFRENKKEIFVYNTLTRQKEVLKPLIDNEFRIYGCGPTVYNYVHIGNFRSFVFYDFIRRVLEFNGYKVKFIMNITDVDDKTIRDSQKNNIPFTVFVNYWENIFFKQIKELNIKDPYFFPRATAHIEEMKIIIQKLIDKGIAYFAEDGIYFSISKFKDYGKLSKIKIENLEAGKRVNVDEYDKDNPMDFALWKFWNERDKNVYWFVSFDLKKEEFEKNKELFDKLKEKGILVDLEEKEKIVRITIKGRPGWHIECSAMSWKYLDIPFDIHLGGIDLIFPHHENEIAQAEAAFDKSFVNYWIHINHLMVEGKKMSKSLGNFYTLEDIKKKGFNPLALRLFYLMSNYDKQQNFTFEALKAAEEKLNYINETYQNYTLIKKYNLFKKEEKNEKLKELFEKIREKVNNNFNSVEALAIYFELLEELNKGLKKRINFNFYNEFLRLTDDLFGLIDNNIEFFFISKEETLNDDDLFKYFVYEIEDKFFELEKEKRLETIKNLIRIRNFYRKNKEFIKADLIRDALLKIGVKLDDWPEGTKVSFKRNLLEK